MQDFELSSQPLKPGWSAAIDVSGYLDAHTFESMEQALSDLFSRGIHRVVINLENLQYISSAGAGVFINAMIRAREAGGDIVLFDIVPSVYETLELLGLIKIFSIAESRDDAIAMIAPTENDENT